MAFDFPDTPSPGAVYTPVGGPTYTYTNGVWMATPATPNLLPTALDQNLLVNPAIQHTQEWASQTTYYTLGTYFADQWMLHYVGPTGNTHVTWSTYLAGDFSTPYGQLMIASKTTAYATVAAGDYASIVQYLEGTVVQQLGWGSGQAIPAVLAFDIQAAMAGTYSVVLRSGAIDRCIAFPIVISAGDVGAWRRFTFAIPAITDGTFARNNTKGLEIWFTFMAGTNWGAPSSGAWLSANYIGLAGQTNFLSSGVARTINLRNLGLYPDPQGTGRAPPFAVPDYATELARCQRYFQKYPPNVIMGGAYGAASAGEYWTWVLPVPMRVAPTAAFQSVANSNCNGPSVWANQAGAVCLVTSVTAAGGFYTYFGMTLAARMT